MMLHVVLRPVLLAIVFASAGGDAQATDYCALAQRSIGMMSTSQRAAAGRMTCDAVGDAYPGSDCSWDGSTCAGDSGGPSDAPPRTPPPTFAGACLPAPASALVPEGSAGGSDQTNIAGIDHCALAQQSIGMMSTSQQLAVGRITCDAVGDAYPGTDCSWEASLCSRSRRTQTPGTCVVSTCREGFEQYCGVYESFSDHTWRQECGTGNNIIHIAPYDRNYWTIANSTNGYTETEWGWGENSVLSWYGSSMESPDRSNTTFGYMFIEIDCVPGAPLPASDIPTRCGGCSAITTPTMCFSAGSGCVWDISAGSGSSDEDTDDLGTGVRAACYFTIRAALKHRALTLCALVEVEVERVLHS